MTFRRALSLVMLFMLSACAFQTYSPNPIDPQATASDLATRAIDTPEFREYIQRHGVARWPVRDWGLRELTLLSFYHHPELKTARANAALARAQEFTARQPLNPGFEVLPEYHSLDEDGRSPWSLNFRVNIPVITHGKREAAAERAGYLAQAAELDVGSAAWKVRNRLRSSLLDMFAAREESQLLRAEAADRDEVLRLLEKRVEFGLIASHETAIARERVLDLALRAQRKEGEIEEARAALSSALGLSVQTVRELDVEFADFREAPAVDDLAAARREALINRLDIRRSLLEYAAAEAALKLEVARQYPDFNLSPGYGWDQEDNVWSLGVALILPLLNRNEGPILEARERREVKARDFLALQAQVIAATESAAVRYESARTELMKAGELQRLAQKQGVLVKKRFDSGDADRLDWVNARLQIAQSEQATRSAAIRLQRARGDLENALQRPLDGVFELPAVTQR